MGFSELYHSPEGRADKWPLLICLLFTLTSCYETEKPAFPEGQRAPLSGVFDCKNYIDNSNGIAAISEFEHSVVHGYSYVTETDFLGFNAANILRLKRIKKNLFILQATDHDDRSAYAFIDFLNDHTFVLSIVNAVGKEPYIEALAAQHKVLLRKVLLSDGKEILIDGDQKDIRSFLLDHDQDLLYAVVKCDRKETNKDVEQRIRTLGALLGIWAYEEHGAEKYLRIDRESFGKVRLFKGYEWQGTIAWNQPMVDGADGVILDVTPDAISGTFSSPNFQATHGVSFTYRVTITPSGNQGGNYSLWSDIGDGSEEIHSLWRVKVAEGNASTTSADPKRFPASFLGIWDYSGQCHHEHIGDGRLTISPETVLFYESECKLIRLSHDDAQITGTVSCEGEGELWQQQIAFSVKDEVLVEHGPDGSSFERVRCHPIIDVEGIAVSVKAPSPHSFTYAEFSFRSQGYENTYYLDCKQRRFRWIRNQHLQTGEVTENSQGSEWLPLNDRSTKANAAFREVCQAVSAD